MTPAVDQLVRLGIAHRTHSYVHDPSSGAYGLEAAEALELEPGAVFKTLLARASGGASDQTGRGRLVVGLVPVVNLLDLKALARAARAKRAEMADSTEAERSTGYVVGGISPFGQRAELETFVDETAELFDTIYVSGGRRGLEIEVAPADLVAVLRAQLVDLAASR